MRAGQTVSRRGWAITVLAGAGLLSAAFAWHPTLGYLDLVLMKLGALAFGGGFTLIPLVQREVVAQHAWLTTREFIDGIALGQVTPGPIMITATFLGYRIAGLPGAVLSTVVVFFPSFVILMAVLPRYDRIKRLPAVQAMVHGVLAAFIALLVFVLLEFARASLDDWKTVAIGSAAAIALWLKVDLLIIVAAAVLVSLLLS
jgi:chromate transporter